MKRLWLWMVLAAGSLAVLTAPAFAKEDTQSSNDDTAQMQDDLNSALGSLSSRVSAMENAPKVEIHGFAEMDYIFDDTQMGLGSETIGDNAQVPKSGSVAQRNGQAQFSPRNSRFDFLAQQTVDGWLTKGYIEGDFLGVANTAENKEYTQPTFRIRHAYLDIQKDGWDIMAGQYWTLFGWNMDNVLATLDVSPIMGSLYQRTPRLGVMKTFGGDTQLQLALDAERPEQASSSLPNLNGGIRFLFGGMKAQFAYATGGSKLVPLSIGISGRLATYSYLPVGATTVTDVTGQGVAIDAQIPLLAITDPSHKDDSTLILTGEWMAGKGVGDALNGWNGGAATAPANTNIGGTALDQGIAGTVGTAFTLIDDQSWNAQLQFHLAQSVGTYFTVGYGETYGDNVYAMAGSTYDDVSGVFGNVVQDFTDHVRAGVEYSRFDDRYRVGGDAIDHRVQLSAWYRF
jgi:hypothetical protein